MQCTCYILAAYVGFFSDMIERFLEVFIDDFSVFGTDFNEGLHHLSLVLIRCKDKNIVLNWEKCHFIVKYEIVLWHIVSEKSIELDKAKVDLISKLPPPKTVREARSFLGHLGSTASSKECSLWVHPFLFGSFWEAQDRVNFGIHHQTSWLESSI